MTTNTTITTAIHCDTCGASAGESCFDSTTGLACPTHPDRVTAPEPRSLSVERAMAVLDADGEVHAVYARGMFYGRYSATTESQAAAVAAWAAAIGGHVVDWVTGERV